MPKESQSLLPDRSCNGQGTMHEDYSSCLSRFLGVFRILFGVTLIAHWITELVLYKRFIKDVPFQPTDTWIQAATFLILSGAAGCVAAKKKNTTSITIHLVLSLMSVTLFGITKLFASGVELGNVFTNDYSDKERRASVIAVYSLSIVTSFLGCVFDFWAFGMSYKAVISEGTAKKI